MVISEQLQQSIRHQFGHTSLRPGQAKVIETLLIGRSVLAIFPTGGGKSLCYQATALQLPGITLVVSPLLALMKDQIDALLARGIAAARLDSSLDFQQYREVCEQARDGRLKLLYVAPERFNNLHFQQLAEALTISLMAIDEAHCISQWGHNFRPDYLKLSRHAKYFGAERILALTATAPPSVAQDICEHLHIDANDVVRTPFYRPNLSLHLTSVQSDKQRDHQLLEKLAERAGGATIIYVTLQKTAELLADKLNHASFSARAYHAGLKDDKRESIQEWFMASADSIVVATIAFGMGIDKADIRYIYHYNPPKSLENYAQEIGRAGRDGEASLCELFYLEDDCRVLENFSYGDTPSNESVEGLVAFIFSHDDAFEVSNYELANQFNLRTLVLRTLLVYLELDDYLSASTPIFTQHKFKPLFSSRDIFAQFSGEPLRFLKTVFKYSSKGKIWFSLDQDAIKREACCDNSRIVRALNHLADRGLLELQASGVVVPYNVTQRPNDIQAVTNALVQRMQQREQFDIDRIAEVGRLVNSLQCQAGKLSAHFGETLDAPCGQCTVCLNEDSVGDYLQAATQKSDTSIELDSNLLKQAHQLQQQHSKALPDKRALARFLVGVSSPASTHGKLGKHALFGALAQVPFAQIMASCETQ